MGFLGINHWFNKQKRNIAKLEAEDIEKGLGTLEKVVSGEIKTAEIVDELIQKGIDSSYERVAVKVKRRYGIELPDESKEVVEAMIFEVAEGKNSKYWNVEKGKVQLGVLKEDLVTKVVPLLITTGWNILKSILPVLIKTLINKI